MRWEEKQSQACSRPSVGGEGPENEGSVILTLISLKEFQSKEENENGVQGKEKKQKAKKKLSVKKRGGKRNMSKGAGEGKPAQHAFGNSTAYKRSCWCGYRLAAEVQIIVVNSRTDLAPTWGRENEGRGGSSGGSRS